MTRQEEPVIDLVPASPDDRSTVTVERTWQSPRRDAQRLARLQRLRASGASQRRIAGELGISRRRVRQLLAEGGDPLLDVASDRLFVAGIERATEAELVRYRTRLVERIRIDLRRVVAMDDELDIRREDRLLGLA